MEAVIQENVDLVDKSLLAQEIICKSVNQPSPLLYMLNELQAKVGYISENAVHQIADTLKIPQPEALSIITFHRQFKLKMNNEPDIVARNVIRVCSGAPCYTNGSQLIVDKLFELLGIQKGEITKDSRFALEVVDCLGTCGMSPVMMVNEDIHGNLTGEQVPQLLDNYK